MKILDNFANIGKAVLIQSIGLQKNYIEVKESETSVIDYNNAAAQIVNTRLLFRLLRRIPKHIYLLVKPAGIVHIKFSPRRPSIKRFIIMKPTVSDINRA